MKPATQLEALQAREWIRNNPGSYLYMVPDRFRMGVRRCVQEGSIFYTPDRGYQLSETTHKEN